MTEIVNVSKLTRDPNTIVDMFLRHRESQMKNSTGEIQEPPFAELLAMARSDDSEAIGKLCELCQKYLLLIANNDLSPQILKKFGASDVVQQSMMIANNKSLPLTRSAGRSTKPQKPPGKFGRERLSNLKKNSNT